VLLFDLLIAALNGNVLVRCNKCDHRPVAVSKLEAISSTERWRISWRSMQLRRAEYFPIKEAPGANSVNAPIATNATN
jgi:hypothetical protein